VICPNCKKEIKEVEGTFCPYCAKSLNQNNRSGLLISSGVLAIIASIFVLPSIVSFVRIITSGLYTQYLSTMLSGVSVFCFIALVFGLVAGISTLKRKRFPLALIGICLVFVSNIIASIFTIIMGEFSSFLMFGLPAAIMLLLSVIFTAASRKKFK
jgi:hypothetical protein